MSDMDNYGEMIIRSMTIFEIPRIDFIQFFENIIKELSLSINISNNLAAGKKARYRISYERGKIKGKFVQVSNIILVSVQSEDGEKTNLFQIKIDGTKVHFKLFENDVVTEFTVDLTAAPDIIGTQMRNWDLIINKKFWFCLIFI